MDIALKDKVKLLLKFGPGRLFVQTLDEHYKYYHVSHQEKRVVVTYGRIGKTQMNDVKEFYSSREAEIFAIKKINEKLNKGYIEIEQATAVRE